MDAAEEAGCALFFSHPLAHADVAAGKLYFYLADSARWLLYQKTVTAPLIFGADGGGSRCRQALKGFLGGECSDESRPLGYGYKELTMPAAPQGAYAVHKDSLHIWPRGSHFMMGLANLDGSFTMTLYMAEQGPVSFASLSNDKVQVRRFFDEFYPSAAKLMPSLVEDFLSRPVGKLATLFAAPWTSHTSASTSSSSSFALIGDAAHAFTPFFGQGCNSGFEDVVILHEILTKHKETQAESSESLSEAAGSSSEVDSEMGSVLREYFEKRKPCTDAIANMALENFDEMMSKTADPQFLLQKDIENVLSEEFPCYVSRYALITHSLLPYDDCLAVGKVQATMLRDLSHGIASVSELDMAAAKALVETTYEPFLLQRGITPDKCHYTSPYYDPV